MPRTEARDRTGESENDELPEGCTVAEQVAAVTCAVEATQTNIEAIGDQGKAREEQYGVTCGAAKHGCKPEQDQANERATSGPGPGGEERMGILGVTGLGETEERDLDGIDGAAAQPDACTVAGFVDRHHRVPRDSDGQN